MGADGGIVAIDLDRGSEVWKSDRASKPLLLSGDLLMGQVEATKSDHTLRIASLKRDQSGEFLVESEVPLPPGVEPLIDQRSNQAFLAKAEDLDGDAAVTWEFVDRALNGLPPGAEEVLPGEELVEAERVTLADSASMLESSASESGMVARGAVRVSPGEGTVRPMLEPHLEAAPLAMLSSSIGPGSELAEEADLPDVPQPQFRSVDGRHVLHSALKEDDRVWDRYLWQIYESDSGRSVGEFSNHLGFAPFVCSGKRIFFLSQPYERLVDGNVTYEPLQVCCFDMDSGTSLWRKPVRDVSDGPPPP